MSDEETGAGKDGKSVESLGTRGVLPRELSWAVAAPAQ